MNRYLALIRGINAGGTSLVKMAELKAALETSGLSSVRTYIQSGNVFFESAGVNQQALAEMIATVIANTFNVTTSVVVFTQTEWKRIIQQAPSWWGRDANQKHNLFILLPPYNMAEAIGAVGELNPELEVIEPGDGVLYQSMSHELLGKTTTGKLASSPIYKRLTVRNYNTATKLLELF